MKKNISRVVNDTAMLYIISIVKLILPLVTLPYLTRVLSEDAYGFVSYVKSCMTYMQLIIDFGFILSSVKDIVKADNDKAKINYIIGTTIVSKAILSFISAVVLAVMVLSIKILQMNPLYVFLSFIGVATTVFFGDFFFRGIEKMQFITFTFLISRGISTALTFVFVRGDDTLIWVPILEIISGVVSGVISTVLIYKLGYKIQFNKIRDCFVMIKDSFVYFLSTVATTAFSALNTLIIGIYITDLVQVAHWSLCISIISAIQGMYAPICNGIYPHMIKERRLSYIHKVLGIFMPIVVCGCVFSYFFAPTALLIVGGEKYQSATSLFRYMIPILFFSFPAQVYGWPTLGAVGKEKETTTTTIVSAIVQIIGIFALILFNNFNLISLALLRCFTECILMAIRMVFVYRNKHIFNDEMEKGTA